MEFESWICCEELGLWEELKKILSIGLFSLGTVLFLRVRPESLKTRGGGKGLSRCDAAMTGGPGAHDEQFWVFSFFQKKSLNYSTSVP